MAAHEGGLSTPLTGAYAFLPQEAGALVSDVLARKDPQLHTRLAEESRVSEDDAEAVQDVLYDEFMDHVSTVDHEPDEYGKRIDDALGEFVAKFVIESRG